MNKIFEFRGAHVELKSNKLKDGQIYFISDVKGVIENSLKLAKFNIKGLANTEENLIIELFNIIKSEGLPIVSLKIGNLVHSGTVMSDFDEQEILE